jgi:AraC-like DNA-binding protein
MESPISQKGNPVIRSFSPKLKMPTAYLPPESGRISVNAPGHSYGPVMRPYHIMHFITGGEGCLEIGGKRFRLGKGDVFYLPEDEICYYYASRVTPWSYSWCAFCGRKAADFQYQFSSLSPDRYILRGIDTDRFAAVIQKAADLQGTDTASYYYANSILLEVFAMFSQLFPAARPQMNSLTEHARFLLDLKYAEKLQIQEIAREMGIHPNYLSQIFHDAYGISPKKYVMQLKLSKAARMLSSTALPVSAISASLGFEDQLSFSRYFRRHMGCAPTEYRKRQRG